MEVQDRGAVVGGLGRGFGDGRGRRLEGRRAGRPGGAGSVGQDRFGLIVEGGEQSGEIAIHRMRVGDPFCVKLGDELCIRAVHGSCDDVYTGHSKLILR